MRTFKLKPSEPLESVVLAHVLKALQHHPRVGWVARMNSGVFRPARKDGSTGFVRAGFEGCADILGQLRTGELLAVEVKRPSGRVTEAQDAFLTRVRLFGGVSFVARGVNDVMEALA